MRPERGYRISKETREFENKEQTDPKELATFRRGSKPLEGVTFRIRD